MEMLMWKKPNGSCHQQSRMMSCSASSEYSIALGCIQHPISKLDTLAGIAIKYGVQVADIKKMNGLVTDRQMFALKTLHIPLPGRHTPSLSLHCNSDNSPPNHAHPELFEPFRSLGMKTSEQKLFPVPAMNSSSQGYYGSVPTLKKSICEVLEMAVCRKGSSNSSENDPFHTSNRPPGHHQKSRSLAERILDDITESSNKWNDTLIRKIETDLKVTPELLLRHDNSNSCRFSSRTGKGLAQRQKAASRITLTTNPVSMDMRGAFLIDGLSGVRKSSSTSCLQYQGNNNIRPTSRRSMKPDLMAFSNAGIAKPIFDGLPKPVTTGRRNKAAID